MKFRSTYLNELPDRVWIEPQRILTTVLTIASILVTTTYSFGVTRPSLATISDVSWHHHTRFTPNSIMTFDIFVGVMYLAQIAYLVTLLSTDIEALLIAATSGVSYHFILYSSLHIMQIVAWTREGFLVVELALLCNAVNLLFLYFKLGPTPHQTTATKNLRIQIPLVKMPLALTLMWLLHNTSILTKSTHTASWALGGIYLALLLAISVIVIVPRDSLLALALSYLLFSVATEQFVRRQTSHMPYIAAFVLAAYTFCLSAAVGVPRFRMAFGLEADEEFRLLH